MKKSLFLGLILVIIGSNIYAQSSDQNPTPTTLEEKQLEATIVCLDAIEAPTKYNEFAKPFITDPSFPKMRNSHDELKKEINKWLVNHPLIIDQVVIERKKAHDKLYGPRPY